MDSSSVLEIFSERLKTNKGTELSLIFCRWEGRGPFPRSTHFMRKNLLLKNKKKKWLFSPMFENCFGMIESIITLQFCSKGFVVE